jgi:hypothetical protein
MRMSHRLQSNDLCRGSGFLGQAADGGYSPDQGGNGSAVSSWPARQFARDLGRRQLRRAKPSPYKSAVEGPKRERAFGALRLARGKTRKDLPQGTQRERHRERREKPKSSRWKSRNEARRQNAEKKPTADSLRKGRVASEKKTQTAGGHQSDRPLPGARP